MKSAIADLNPAAAAALTLTDVLAKRKSAALAGGETRFKSLLDSVMLELGLSDSSINAPPAIITPPAKSGGKGATTSPVAGTPLNVSQPQLSDFPSPHHGKPSALKKSTAVVASTTPTKAFAHKKPAVVVATTTSTKKK